ncbi:MAG: PilZ domain-containing protein [Anaerolineae bacterium]|nr:PilZ domain-containing protein [Anaerolineae bacterium]
MDERRKQPRKDLMSYSQVFDLRGGYLIGYLGDINLLGAMVISDHEIKPDTELSVSIQLPELENFSESSMSLSARVAYSKPDLSPEYFNVGMEFKSVSEKQKEIIEAVMENYEFRRQSPNYPKHPNEVDERG